MPEFNYTARNKNGEIVSETMTASSREALAASLRARGLLPTAIREKRRPFWNFKNLGTTIHHVSLLEKLTFIKNLSVTIRAGLPVSRALKVLARQMDNAYFQQVISEIAQSVESGKTLSESMARYDRIFSPITVSMVRVGESSGELDNILEYLGAQIARDYNLIRRTRGAMIYPAVVLVALAGIGYLMFTFVLPRLTESFKEFNTELPALTRAIIRTVDIFSHYSAFILFGFIALIIGFVIWHRTPSGRRVVHKLFLTAPIVKGIVKKLNLARFTIIFGGLLKSGMPIVEALKITSETMTNVYYQDAIADASEKVRIGVDLVAAIDKYPHLFTPMVSQMIAVGEESGTMEKVLAEVAAFYETEVDETVSNLSSIIEPVLIMVIGAVVGVLAIGLILPIYNLSQSF